VIYSVSHYQSQNLETNNVLKPILSSKSPLVIVDDPVLVVELGLIYLCRCYIPLVLSSCEQQDQIAVIPATFMEPQSSERGIYTLVLHLDRSREMVVGSLGFLSFAGGYYCYTGSAQGRGGLRRVDRHLQVMRCVRTTKRWHIDYLLPFTSFQEVFTAKTSLDLECQIARCIGEKVLPVKGFGCTDCRCTSHLHYSSSLEEMLEAVRWAYTSKYRQ
jgi:Uri superfamily endonuclease